MDRIEIRPLAAQDRAAWEKLWEAYLAFYQTALPRDVYDSTFERLLADDPQEFHGAVAVLDGAPCGLVHYLFHRHCWRIENTCYLQDLYTDPSVRGQGVGRALIEAVYAEADRAGAPAVWWLTQEFNHVGRRLYDRIGKLTPFIRYNR